MSITFKINEGVSAVQFDVRKVDADCSAVVKDGVMCVTLEPKVEATRAEYVCDHPRAEELAADAERKARESAEATRRDLDARLDFIFQQVADGLHALHNQLSGTDNSDAPDSGKAGKDQN